MESFYGGKSGFSFIIVKSFSSVAEMVENFKKGPIYSAVHYDEHVLINTENKNNPDNGKVFRRGYDYTNEMGGAVYVGTIVGPAGRAPMLELTTIEQVKLKQKTEGFNNRYSEGNYSVPVSLTPGKDGTKFNDVVEWACCCVRSKNGEDSIAYIGFNFPYLVNEFTAQSVSPYYHRSDNTDNFINENLTDRVDDKTHPFYEKWHFNIPKGIKGDAFKNFRVMEADTTIQDYTGRQDDINQKRKVLVYDYYHYDKDENGEPISVYLGDYNMIKNITFSEDGSVTIDYTHDDTKVFNKLIRWMVRTRVEEDGTFVITYNTGETESFNNIIQWISKITLTEDGVFTVKYNNGAPDDVTILRWVKDIKTLPDGTVEIIYNSTEPVIHNKMIKWITDVYIDDDYKDGNEPYTLYFSDESKLFKFLNNQTISAILSEENGDYEIITNKTGKTLKIKNASKYFEVKQCDYRIHIVYNTGEVQVIGEPIKFLKNLKIDDTKRIHITYNTGEEESIGEPIKYINKVYVDDTQHIHIIYNTEEEAIIGDPIKWITDVYIDDDYKDETMQANVLFEALNNGTTAKILLSEDKYQIENDNCLVILDSIIINGLDIYEQNNKSDYKFHVTYNVGYEEAIGQPINFIKQTVVDTKDYHLLVFYSNARLRESLIAAGKTRRFGGKAGWVDLGSIKDDSGVLVGLNIVPTETLLITEIEDAIRYLNKKYPNGLTDKKYYGKIVTVGKVDENKKFYAFDYDTNNWYYLGTFNNTAIWTLLCREDDPELEEKQSLMEIGGIWFILED